VLKVSFFRYKYQKHCVFAGILSPHVLKMLFFAGILSTQISKALCFCWYPITSCVKSAVFSGHPIDTNIKNIMFLLASYRHKSQKHSVFASILSPHVLKLSLPDSKIRPAAPSARQLQKCIVLCYFSRWFGRGCQNHQNEP
jgi:hypothetical protein